MKKIILFLVFSVFCSAQSKLTKEENDIISAVVSRELTQKEQTMLDNYMNKKFVNANIFMADTKKIIKEWLYVPIEEEAECAGILIARANKDGYKLTNKTYEQIWDAAGNYCREYYYPSLEAKELKKYNDTKFNNLTDFRFETKRLMTSKVLKITESEYECAIRFIKSAFDEGYDVTKNTYEEIIENGKVICDNDKKEEKPKEEKPPVLTPSYNEANQYIQVHFSKNKQGISFNEFKIVNGDNVSFDIKTTLLEQINKDFSNDKNGNYTAFYDVFYINSEPKKIKLKTRLNR